MHFYHIIIVKMAPISSLIENKSLRIIHDYKDAVKTVLFRFIYVECYLERIILS